MAVLASRVLRFGGADEDVLKIEVSPSPLSVGDEARIDLYAPEQYVLGSHYQGLTPLPSNGPAQQFVEDVDVQNQASITTQYPVASVQQAHWLTGCVDIFLEELVAPIGAPLTIPVVNNRLAFDGTKLYGTIRLSYTTFLPQKWKHAGFPQPGIYALWYNKVGAPVSARKPLIITVGPGQASEQSQPSIVTVQAKDFCTDLPIQGASVYVDSQFIGTSDINGKVVVGVLPAGSHSLKIQAPGYLPTDGDALQNDSFSI